MNSSSGLWKREQRLEEKVESEEIFFEQLDLVIATLGRMIEKDEKHCSQAGSK